MTSSTHALACAFLLGLAALAGCFSPEEASQADAEIDRVLITAAPDLASPGSDANVCWRVEGNGTIGGTAIFYGPISSPSPENLQAYDEGPLYPDGRQEPAEGGYALPNTFCTTLPVYEKGAMYLRAGAWLNELTAGDLSPEHAIRVADVLLPPYPWVLSAPETVPPGEDATVCWYVHGNITVEQTGVTYGSQAVPDVNNATDYDGGIVYPDNATEPRQGGYQLPGEFCTAIPVPETAGGDVYFRAFNSLQNADRQGFTIERAIRAAEPAGESGD